MGFCTDAEHEEFMGSVSEFEQMLVGSGVTLLANARRVSTLSRICWAGLTMPARPSG